MKLRLGLLVLFLLALLAPTPVLANGGAVNCNNVQGTHIVRTGETLYSIGRAYATNPFAIATCNGIANPNRLAIGTALAIPVAPWSPVPPGPTAIRQFGDPSPTCRYHHTVLYGETLIAIGLRYNVSIWDIAAANNIYNLNLIYAGRVLCIP